ncbi:STAS domain-containing protein [Desulfosporosinus sp. BICA1-9]|uniref:STAS domain-containing protein n=1 Tax=Desulfosporosinus sp. BICA1-9 TaxID=1531958 RepID=UPI000AE83658
MDFAALGALKVFMRMLKEAGSTLIICGVKSELELMLKNTDLTADVGTDNFFMSENEIYASSTNALQRARAVLGCNIVDNSSPKNSAFL